MKPHTHTAQYLGKWHAGFTIGNQSFTFACNEGTEEEAQWFASMLDKAFANLRAKDAELIQQLVDAGNAMRDAIKEHMDDHVWDIRIPYSTELDMNKAAQVWDAAQGFKPSEQ